MKKSQSTRKYLLPRSKRVMYYEEKVPHVLVGEDWVPTDEVEFVDIEEDFQGYDVMTFLYKGEEIKSRVILKYI